MDFAECRLFAKYKSMFSQIYMILKYKVDDIIISKYISDMFVYCHAFCAAGKVYNFE